MHDTTDSRATRSRWSRLTSVTGRLTPSRSQAWALFLATLMITSLPIMFTGGFGADSGTAMAQEDDDDVQYYDDFEDGSHDDWSVWSDGSKSEISSDSFWGSQSLYQHESDHDGLSWDNGPQMDLSENFEVSGTMKHSGSDYRNRVGFVDSEGEQTALLSFSIEYDAVFLATHWSDDLPDDEGMKIDGDHADKWVDFRLQTDGGTVRAKVWESGTAEPDQWQMEREYNEFEGHFLARSSVFTNDNTGDRELWLDRIDAGGHSLSGQVVDSDGEPVDSATVETLGVDYDALNETSEDLESDAEELLDQIDDVEPDYWDPDYDLQSHYSDADGTYVLAHAEDDWNVGTTTVIDSTVDTPRLQFDSDQDIELSMWDPAEDGGWFDNQVDQSFPGATTEGTIVVEQVGAGTDIVDRTEHETNSNWETTGSNPLTTNEHQTVKLDLSSGFYRAYPEGSPERGYTFVVGSPQELLQTFEQDLRNEAGELTDRAEGIMDNVGSGALERRTTTTNENGEFDLRMQRGTQRATVQAYRGDGEILTDITGPSFSDLRDAAEGHYNGSFYVGAPERHDVPSDDVELTVHRTDELPFRAIEDYADLQDWLEEDRLDERLDDVRDDYDERLDELNQTRLEQVYESHRVIIETVPGAEDAYLDESEFDEIQAAGDLSTDELETETELMQETLLGEDLEDITDIEPPEIPEDPLDISGGELNAEYPLPPGIDEETITPEIHWSDGTSEEIDGDYWSIDESIVGTNTLVIDGFPIDSDDPGAFDIRFFGANEDGVLDDRISGVNPDFGGDLVQVDAVDFSTLEPGPDERVHAEIDAPSGYEGVTSVDVFGPDGSQLESADVDAERDRVSFRTDGEGDHHVRMELESTSGHTFTVSEHVKAKSQSRSSPATVRISSSPLGPHAVVGEQLDTARVDGVTNPSIEAVADSGDAPGQLHIYPGEMRGLQNEIDVSVLEGSAESQVNKNVQLYVHIDSGLGENDISWRDGNPITQTGDTQWGEVDHRDTGKSVMTTYTEDDGTATIEVQKDAGIVDRVLHWVSYTVPGVDSVLSVTPPLLETMLSVAAEPATVTAPVSPAVPTMAPLAA